MSFSITKEKLVKGTCKITIDTDALAGVKRIAKIVSGDIEKVFGTSISICETDNFDAANSSEIVVATLGYGTIAETLAKNNIIDLNAIKGKREVYHFVVFEDSLYIVGSDKRGTIYGLFKLSELMGVSPLVNWNHVPPVKKENFELETSASFISKEPSVKYRGFFINDEWPAFGNWSDYHFGGFNSKCYEQVFELLLRLKGNYLWPAMWSAVFSEDGPGLANEQLADEMGVIIGMSHHEPCLRNGEEYSHVRGKDSIYGDAWNFRTNEAGITKFWEDGLKRNGKFENVITVGMRGEADSTIMGKDATLKDNIDLLRDVLKTQNRLIREQVNPNLDEVPRMLALYKEVEPFYYGDENTEGLMNCEELEGVTLMLCDDNFGNLRTVPTDEMRDHKGGFGMYYHFDYHGWPISFEWLNSSNIAKTCEQMSEAYEFGIRELWIVNVGDIFSTEYPLSYFLDLAYDFEKWGNKEILCDSSTYTTHWVDKQFGAHLSDEQKKQVEKLLLSYTHIASQRRPEAMNEKVYPAIGCKAYYHRLLCEKVMNECEKLYSALDDNIKNTFFQLVYYPLMGNLNVHKLWADTAINHYLSAIGSTAANEYGDKVYKALEFDKELINKLHTEDDCRWYGMGMSEHIGFKNWNEEECANPVVMNVISSNKPRIIVANPMNGEYTEGGDWTKKTLVVEVSKQKKRENFLLLCATSNTDSTFEITQKTNGIVLTDGDGNLIDSGVVAGGTIYKLYISVDSLDMDKLSEAPFFAIHTQTNGNIRVELEINEDVAYIDGELTMEASDFDTVSDGANGAKFEVLNGYGKYKDGLKAVPVNQIFVEDSGPKVTYKFELPKEGKYTVEVHSTPTNPAFMDGKILYEISFNGKEKVIKNAVKDNFRVGDDQPYWMNGVLENIRINEFETEFTKGINTIKLSAISPCFVIQRIVIKG